MAELEVKAFGFDPAAERNLFHLALPGLDDFPEYLPLSSPYFKLFVASDSQNIAVQTFARFTKRALEQGAVYVCTWGPDCERVHDIFDETIVESQMRLESEEYQSSDVMTTWHNNETLEDALESFLFASNPDDKFSDKCKAAIVVSIANEAWARDIDDLLLAQVPADARTYVYLSNSNGQMWMRDDFDEPLEEFAEYM